MNVLLIYPEYPDTYFSFKHALPFISKKASVPPLGLITVAAMLPDNWDKKLVDLNVSPLLNSDIEWTDFVFISAMYIQKKSVNSILEKCAEHKVVVVAGGPLFTHEHSSYPQIDHFILNEAEITILPFLKDIETGNTLKKLYKTSGFPDISLSPVPQYHLLSIKDYASLNIQLSRGCPFFCDFCEIPALLGNKVRMKENLQIIKELDAIYKLNWRGSVSIVDDNFIGKKKEVKSNLLPALIKWMKKHNYPFIFNVQTSIDLSDDDELMSLMVQAGINTTFIGIESPSEESIDECNKVQNKNRNMLLCVRKIQKAGLQVSGGFIVGFDSDSPSVFQQYIDFIQQSGIVWAMVGLLNAPKNTKLYKRLEEENRLTTEATGSNTDYTMNFIPKMDSQELRKGYKTIIHNIYSAKPYYRRIRQFLINYKPANKEQNRLEWYYLTAFFKSVIIIGILNKGRREYWKFFAWTLLHRPRLFLDASMFTICGYHFRKVYGLVK